MNDGNAKQQIVEKIKSSSNILVTVSTNPSVDELSAALGLTLLINKLDKHATAVFSGAVPPAITFLDPEKTFESTVDSLRDFIIALDKEKADHLRYKVEGDVVKIFITPYRTTITSDDLDFSQGDYNVELVIGLGVKTKGNLDQALSAHGRILHDATVATISAGSDKSELGSIDWYDSGASSLSEMLVSLGDSLKSGDKALIDEQIATSFLTGIVAATDRFSNNRTSSRVMTMAAQLMSAGANQQLIASKLEQAHEISNGSDAGTSDGSGSASSSDASTRGNADGTTDLAEGQSSKVDRSSKGESKESSAEPEPAPESEPEPSKPNDGSLSITHDEQPDDDKLERRSEEVAAANQDAATKEAEAKLADQLSAVAPEGSNGSLSVADLQKDLAQASADVDEAAELPPVGSGYIETPRNSDDANASDAVSSDAWKQQSDPGNEPSLGGTLNATTEQAAEDKRREELKDRNRTILNHPDGYVDDKDRPSFQSPLNSAGQSNEEPSVPDPFSQATAHKAEDSAPTASARTLTPPTLDGQTLADIDRENRQAESAPASPDASQAANDALSAAAPAGMPPLPDFSTLPPPPPVPDFGVSAAAPSASPLPEPGLNQQAPLSPQPGGNDQPSGALPPDRLEDMLGKPAAQPPQGPNDPGQFKIPGQN